VISAERAFGFVYTKESQTSKSFPLVSTLSIGPTLDLGLTGSTKSTVAGASATQDIKATDLGVHCALLGFF
jgi:hypothetical protein